MKVTLLVPVDQMEAIEMHSDISPAAALTEREVAHLVSVNLTLDDKVVGTVYFTLDAAPVNERATAITGLLTASYVQVRGLAGFEIDDDAVGSIMLGVES